MILPLKWNLFFKNIQVFFKKIYVTLLSLFHKLYYKTKQKRHNKVSSWLRFTIHYLKECYLCVDAVMVVEAASVDAGGSSYLSLLSSAVAETDLDLATTAVATTVADANYPAIIAT